MTSVQSAVNPPWLEKKSVECWLHRPVTEVFAEESAGKGRDNFMSDLHRLTVRTIDDEEISLIVKCRMEEGTAATILKESLIFRKEQEMYATILPRMTQLLRNTSLEIIEPLAPRCLHSCKNFLVMEDLSVAGYQMMNRREGLDLKQCLMLMRCLARFHAASIAVHEEDPQSMKELEINFFNEPNSRKNWKICFRAMTKMMVEEMETWPVEQWGSYVEKLRRMEDDFLERVVRVTTRRESDYNVLIHGDIWVNNMLFNGDSIRLIDFQFVQFTSVGIDLQLFLTTSPNMEVRVNHLDTLIKEYHKVLCDTLTSLGCERRLLTLEVLYEEYYKKSTYGLFGIVCAASVMLSDPDCGFDLNEAMKGKTPGPSMYSEYFKKVTKLAIPELDKMGAFDDN